MGIYNDDKKAKYVVEEQMVSTTEKWTEKLQ